MAQRMSRTLPVLLAGLCALSSQISAATNDSGWSARVWRLDDGLPDNRVTGIVQTPDNYLWLATHSGLARFDGVRFENIALPIPSGRTRPLIRAMLLGRENRLWLALEGGLVVSLSRERRDRARFAERRVDRLCRRQRESHRQWARDSVRRQRPFGQQRAVQRHERYRRPGLVRQSGTCRRCPRRKFSNGLHIE